jgi:hypothetical protein
MVSTNDVVDRHLRSFAEHDVEGVLADYSSDAVLFVPSGPLKGPVAIKPLFEALISEFAKPGSSFTMQLRYVEGDLAYILWSAETADNSYEFATDSVCCAERENSGPIVRSEGQAEALNRLSVGICAALLLDSRAISVLPRPFASRPVIS